MANTDRLFLGIKQVKKATYNSTSDENKKGYVWFVRDNDGSKPEIYLGTRLYANLSSGGTSGDYYTKQEIDNLLDAIRNDLDVVEGDIDNIKQSITTINNELRTINNNINVLSGRVTNLSGVVESVSGSVTNLSGSVVSLSGSVVSLSGSVTNLSGTVEDIVNELKTVFDYKGEETNLEDLPSDAKVGDVYQVQYADGTEVNNQYYWNGEEWVPFGGEHGGSGEEYLVKAGTGITVNRSGNEFTVSTKVNDGFTTTQKVGYIEEGTTFHEGTTWQDILQQMLCKVRGLESSAVAPKAGISGINTETIEVGTVINKSVTASYTDGNWNNEGGWKLSGSTKQMYGTTCNSYTFNGMGVVGSGNTGTVSGYTVQLGTQRVSVTANNTNSTNVPIAENGSALASGSSNNSTTYKPYTAANPSANSNIITGKYKWFIGTISGETFTAQDIRDLKYSGFVGNAINVSFNDEGGTDPSVTTEQTLIVAVQTNYALTQCKTLLGAPALVYFTVTDNYADVSLDNTDYKLYTFRPGGSNTIMEAFVIG